VHCRCERRDEPHQSFSSEVVASWAAQGHVPSWVWMGDALPASAVPERREGRLITGPIAQILNLPQPTGYLVKSVARGSAGDSVGLIGGAVLATIMGEQLVVGGDIILKVQGIPVGEVSDHRRVRDILDSVPPGGDFTMTVLRLGKVVELKGKHP